MNPYSVLGLDSTATAKEIKKAFKTMSQRLHPDKNSDPDAAKGFQAVQDAYEQIGNKKSKLKYDTTPKKKDRISTVITLEQAFHGCTLRSPKYGDIVVPKGIRDRGVLHLKDTDVLITIKPHKLFLRSKDDLLVEAEVNALDVMLGRAKAEFSTIEGKKAAINVPADIQHDQVITMQGYGMHNPEIDKRGDLLIKIKIKLPALTQTEKHAIINALI